MIVGGPRLDPFTLPWARIGPAWWCFPAVGDCPACIISYAVSNSTLMP